MLFRLNFNNPIRLAASISVAVLTVSLAACGGAETTDTDTAGTDTSSGGAAEGKLALSEPVSITGAGASFPAPLYQRWFVELNGKYPDLQVDYQSVGSGAGVKQFIAGTVDFGASDVAMTDEEIAEVQRGVLLLPMTAGSIVLAYNVPGIESGLKLPREVYVDIFLGNITNWNDPQIAEANPDLDLPDLPITVVHRSDGSGTTGVFTMHLSAISPEWKEQVGEGKTVEWPTGVGGAKNDGVTAQVNQNEGAIGYVEYGFAKSKGLPVAALENSSGEFIEPTDESASKTLESVELPDNFRAFVTDPEGEESYPIVTYTWLLAYKEYEDPQTAKGLEAAIEYGLTEGQEISPELGYIKLPQNVREKIAAAADAISPDYEIDVQ